MVSFLFLLGENETFLLGVIALTLGVIGAVAMLAIWIRYLLRRRPSCPNCGRQRAAGYQACPSCGSAYEPASSAQVLPSSEAPIPSAPVNEVVTASLICVQGSANGQYFSIQSPITTLGRSPENRIPIQGLLASRRHAQISFRSGQYLLEDLESTNGTYVNDHRIVEQHTLKSGDRIQIGETIFVYRVESGASAIRPVSPPSVRPPLPTVGVPSAVGQGLHQYRIVEMIGSGGAAIVYKGISLVDQSVVAVKVLNEVDPTIRRKFEQEGKIGLGLRNQHIARIFDFGVMDGTYYIVMEYVDGGSLRQKLTHGRPVSFDFARTVIGQACEALTCAHAQHVIHRDIKPENILFSTRDGIKVVDFGIAKLTTASTKSASGILIGTPFYMSYDQAAGLPVTPASDIYSLGIVLYEMLTGDWPFSGEPLAVVQKHLVQPPPPPRRLNPTIPAEIETVVMRALDKDARRRYQSAMEFASALGYRPGESISSHLGEGNRTVQPHRDWEQSAPNARPDSMRARPGAARLVAVSGGGQGKEFGLVGESVLLGRDEIDPRDLVISRQQMRLICQAGEFWVEDCGSRNGTFVNGERIYGRTRLRPGTLVQVGHTVLRFER